MSSSLCGSAQCDLEEHAHNGPGISAPPEEQASSLADWRHAALPCALLRCTSLAKSFHGFAALRDIDFDLQAGEVHAVAGENGAGKSTLMHLLAGVHRPDAGSIELDGYGAVQIADEGRAQRLGIAIVYQERSLFNLLSVAENLFVNHPPVNSFGVVNRRRLYQEAGELLKRVELNVDPRLPLERLSPAEQQMVEIAKALSFQSRVFILDEPTAALTVPETRTLFRIIGQLKQRGVGIVYISHRLEEIFEIADRVSILKDGAMQGTWKSADVTPEMLIAKMVGRERLEVLPGQRTAVPGGVPKLAIRNICDRKLKGVSFEVSGGEILGMAGLAGAGRTETAMAIFGCRPLQAGEVQVDGQPLVLRSPHGPMAAGIGYLPEDRKELGLFLRMSIAENIAAARLDYFGSWRLSSSRMEAAARGFVDKLRIATAGVSAPVGSLSGGNQQKVLLARWLLRDPQVLIVDEPTRGVDVGAKAEIHRILRELAGRGSAIIVISSELPEILAVSDRVLVMREGKVAAILDKAAASEETILRFAAIPPEQAA